MSGSSGTLLVDVVVVLAMIAYAITGYRRGFFVGVLSLAGFIAGAFVAAAVVPGLVRGVTPALIDAWLPKRFPLKRLTSPLRTFTVLMAASLCAVSILLVPPRVLWRESRVAGLTAKR